MTRSFSLFALLFTPVAVAAPQQDESPVHIFVLAGQSNMVGAGEVVARPDRNGGAGSLEHIAKGADAEPKYAKLVDEDGDFVVRDDVFISYLEHDGPLSTGFGGNEQQIGPEFMFGHVVGDAIDAPVLLIKIAWGGKSLAVDFRPPSAGGEVGPYYTELVERVRDVRAKLGEQPVVGLVQDRRQLVEHRLQFVHGHVVKGCGHVGQAGLVLIKPRPEAGNFRLLLQRIHSGSPLVTRTHKQAAMMRAARLTLGCRVEENFRGSLSRVTAHSGYGRANTGPSSGVNRSAPAIEM